MPNAEFKIPQSLKDALQNRQVVPFVGAGASMTVLKRHRDGTKSNESLFPSWRQFIEVLAQILRNEQKTAEAEYVLSSINLSKPKYLEAIQHAQEALGKYTWYQLLDDFFNVPQSQAYFDSLRLNRLIWELSNNLIITTNIDPVLEWTCPQRSELVILDAQSVQYALLQNAEPLKHPTILYLHGHIKNKEKIIFTHKEYEALYKQKENQAKIQILLNLLSHRIFLFIGLSFDKYLRELLENIQIIYKGGTNFYTLLRERDIETANLPEYVKPVLFSDYGAPLEGLMEEMARIANPFYVEKQPDTYISQIHVRQSRNLNNLTINLSENKRKHLIITGKNGSGKTSLLNDLKFFLQPDGREINYDNFIHNIENLKSKEELKESLNPATPKQKRDLDPNLEQVDSEIKTYKGGVSRFGETEIYFTNSKLLTQKIRSGEFLISFFEARRSAENIVIPTGINKVNLKKKYKIEEKANTDFIQYIVNLKADRSFARDDGEIGTVERIDIWFNSFEERLREIFESPNLQLKFDRKI